MGHADHLTVLGAALLVAALLATAGRRLGIPTIPLFMAAGILLGPHTPGLDLVGSPGELAELASLGLVFLLFYLGLEFDPRAALSSGARKLLLAGTAYLLLNVGAGLGLGLALGWGWREALVLAGILGISSSAIATKILVDTGRITRPESRVILGIIVLEDVFLAVYLAGLQPALHDAGTLTSAARDLGVSLAFLGVLVALVVRGRRLLDLVVGERDDELLVVIFVGLALFTAGAAEHLGISDAIGAFMIGAALGQAKSAARIRVLVHPLRDLFGALLFLAFGMSVDPGDVGAVAVPIAAAVLLTIVMNMLAGWIAARLHGLDNAAAVALGCTVLARGEFALVLAAMAAAAGLDPRLAPFVAGYVLILATLSPLAAEYAPRLVLTNRQQQPAPPVPQPA